MKVFISQPMKNRSEDNIREERQKVINELVAVGHTVVDSVISKPEGKLKNESVYMLGESIKLMSSADAVFFMNGWRKARGCRLEHDICKEYDIKIIND